MRGRTWVGLAHDDEDGAARVAYARRPPLAAIDDVVVAIAHDGSGNVGGIRRSHIGFGHQKRRANLAIHQRAQPLFLVRQCAVALQHFHVAGIGRRAVEHFRGPRDAAHFLGTAGVFEVAKTRPFEAEAGFYMEGAMRRRHEEVPQARGARFLLQVFQHRRHLPAVLAERFHLRVVHRYGGNHVLAHEGADTVDPVVFAFGSAEVHGKLRSRGPDDDTTMPKVSTIQKGHGLDRRSAGAARRFTARCFRAAAEPAYPARYPARGCTR